MKKLTIFLCICVLGFNLFLALQVPLFTTNFTGLTQTHPFQVSLWALGSSLLFLIQLNDCAKHLSLSKQKRYLWAILCELLCLMTLFLPYTPDKSPLLSGLHLVGAYGFFLSISGYYLFLLVKIQFHELPFFQKSLMSYLCLFFLCGFIFMHYLSINGLFEVIYTSGFALCLVTLHLKVLDIP